MVVGFTTTYAIMVRCTRYKLVSDLPQLGDKHFNKEMAGLNWFSYPKFEYLIKSSQIKTTIKTQ
jgi:hypothetical protein